MPCVASIRSLRIVDIETAGIGSQITLPAPWNRDHVIWTVTRTSSGWHFNVDRPDTCYTPSELETWLEEYQDLVQTRQGFEGISLSQFLADPSNRIQFHPALVTQ